MMLPIAHASHWAVQLLYLAPVGVLIAVLVSGKLRDRRESDDGADPDREPTLEEILDGKG